MIANRMAQLSDDLEYISVSHLDDLKKKYSLHSYRCIHWHQIWCSEIEGWKKQNKNNDEKSTNETNEWMKQNEQLKSKATATKNEQKKK